MCHGIGRILVLCKSALNGQPFCRRWREQRFRLGVDLFKMGNVTFRSRRNSEMWRHTFLSTRRTRNLVSVRASTAHPEKKLSEIPIAIRVHSFEPSPNLYKMALEVDGQCLVDLVSDRSRC